MATRAAKRIDWPAVAAALAARIPHGKLHSVAMETARADWLRAKRRRETPSRWALAFSGGADSLALLLILWAEGAGRWGRDFVALHFNHRLRGREAEADERFCAQVCVALGVKFVAGRWAAARKGASEAEARAARFGFFQREMNRRKIRLLWLGHQQDDIAETMLMRLARGSGAGGLAAPRPAQALPGGHWRLRPLLPLRKAEIVAALRAAGAVWREDATNAGGDFFRNRIRRAVLPAWVKAAGRDALAGAALARERLEEDDAALETWLDEVLPGGPGAALNLRALAGRPRALWRRALHRWLAQTHPGVGLSREGFANLLTRCEVGTDAKVSLGAENYAVIARGRLQSEHPARLSAGWGARTLRFGETVLLPTGAEVAARWVTVGAARRAVILHGAVDPAKEAYLDVGARGAPALRVRPWRAGDRYCPLGAPGATKLQDAFVNRKIPGLRRRRLPVFAMEGLGVVWVPGLPPAERVKITRKTNRALQLTYREGTTSLTH